VTRDGLTIMMEVDDKKVTLIQDGKNAITDIYNKDI
jgi:hypothetical protein